jgi:hypothetical protein
MCRLQPHSDVLLEIEYLRASEYLTSLAILSDCESTVSSALTDGQPQTTSLITAAAKWRSGRLSFVTVPFILRGFRFPLSMRPVRPDTTIRLPLKLFRLTCVGRLQLFTSSRARARSSRQSCWMLPKRVDCFRSELISANCAQCTHPVRHVTNPRI